MAFISFRLLLGLLFGIQFWLYAEGQGRMTEKHALIGQEVNLTCNLNSTEDVTWLYIIRGTTDNHVIFTCHNDRCKLTKEVIVSIISSYFDPYKATRTNETSILSLTPSKEAEHYFKCKLGNDILQEYSVKSNDPQNIVPICSVTLPSRNVNENGVDSMIMTLSCEVNLGELDVNLTLEGIGLNILDDDPRSSKNIIAKTLNFNNFTNIHNASCNAFVPAIKITRPCTYPSIIKVQYIVEGNDIIVGCDNESDVDHWRFYGSDGKEEDIEERSWIREGGRSLLIQNISERDVGKVVVCLTSGDNQTNKGTIVFTVISDNSGDNNKSNSEGIAPTHSAHDPYLVLMLLFLTLWLITVAVGGVWLGCTPKRNKSSTFAIASASGNASVPNGGSGERETPLFNVGTGVRGDPNTLNTNNSAHNPAFEPEVNIADENNRNRQSNNESHLYFTLEKSSPSPMNSLPRASTARREQPDTNPASLNHPQSSHWQGYETVEESSKGATSSYDLGEYAEVGYQIQGKGPPDLGEYAEVGKHFQEREPPDLGEYAEVGGRFQGKGPPDLSGRPFIRKKPGREKVKENNISSLYSKVNK